MKRLIHITSSLFLAAGMLLATNAAVAQAPAGGHGHHGHQGHQPAKHQHDQHAQNTDVVKATVVDGVQVAEVEVGPMGYSAKRVSFEPGVPARLVFTRTEKGGCTDQVQIPELGVEATDLPIGEPVAFDFSPETAAEFTFACAMDMAKGTIVVGG